MKLPCRVKNLLFAESLTLFQSAKDEEIEDLGIEDEAGSNEYRRAIFCLDLFEGGYEWSDTECNCTFDNKDFTIRITFIKLCEILKEYFSNSDMIFKQQKN